MMKLCEKISELEAPIHGIELNAETPSGLFESDTGNRYMVGHTSLGMVAVVLRHRTRPSFDWTLLSPSSIETGVWLGNGELDLIHCAPEQRSEDIGTLAIEDEGWISVRCHPQGTERQWLQIAGTRGSVEDGYYDGWRILKWGRPFFEQSPPWADFPLVLPFDLLVGAENE